MPKTAKLEGPKPAQIKPDLTQAKPGDNGPDRDEYLFLVGRIRDAEDKLKEARTYKKKVRQAAKLRGLNLAMADLVRKVSGEEDDTHLTELKDFKRYAQFEGLPIGYQMELFDKPQAGNGHAPSSLEEMAYKRGYELGVMGRGSDEQAFPPMTPEGQEHMRGWHDGQKVNHDKFLKLNEEIAAEAAAKEAKKAARAAASEATH